MICFLVFNGFSQDIDLFFTEADTFFKTHVAEGKVAYSNIHKNQEGLTELLRIAEGIEVSKDDAKTYQAFWINVYNLSVIK